jgi:release factor glutamine methyltransferase
MKPTTLSSQKIRALVGEGEYTLAAGPHPERARRDAESLLLHLFKRNDAARNTAWLAAHSNNPTSHGDEFRALIQRRLTGEPIQYITGETEFYGLPFLVTPDVLIPRPETEHLVEKVIELAATLQSPRIVDVGTGSGAIAVALSHALKGHDFSRGYMGQRLTQVDENAGCPRSLAFGDLGKHEPKLASSSLVFDRAAESSQSAGALAPEGSSSTPITAIDLSAPALAIARKNAARNNATIRFLQGDLLTPVANERFEIEVSNPPYVPEPDRPTLAVEVRDHEPALALFAGPDGLDIYRRLIPQSFACLVPGGFLVLEIGYNQSPAIAHLLAAAGFQNIEFVPDLQQIPRVATAQRL